MESIQKRINKDIARKSIKKKNNLWLIPIVIATVFITYYSYETNKGTIAKQSIQKEFRIKNQSNLHALFNDNINTADNAYDKMIADDKIPTETEILPQEVLVQQESITPVEVAVEMPIPNKPFIQEVKQPIAVVKNEIPQAVTVKPELNALPKTIVSEEKVIDKVNVAITEPVPTNVVKVDEKEARIKAIAQAMKPSPLKTMAEEKAQNNSMVIKEKKAHEISPVVDPKANFTVEKCYDSAPNDSNITPECSQNLTTFLQKHKDASRFEVIGIYNLIDEKSSTLSSDILAKARVDIGKKLIKEILGEKTEILNQSYLLKTELENRGVVIRAYN